MLTKTLKFVLLSLSTNLYLSSIIFVGPGTCFPGFCTDMHSAILFDSFSECEGFIASIEYFIDYELGLDLDVTPVEIMSQLYE